VPQRSGQGLGHHDHARTTAKGAIIDPLVIAGRKITGIAEMNINSTYT
jgi:hypothetical protein